MDVDIGIVESDWNPVPLETHRIPIGVLAESHWDAIVLESYWNLKESHWNPIVLESNRKPIGIRLYWNGIGILLDADCNRNV